MNLSLKNIAEEYFSSLNPIAERISIDVAATKNAYEDLWHTLNLNDQCQVINETIIHPEVMLKYSFHLKDTPELEYFTHKLDTQEKYVGDDEGGKGSANQHLGFSWHDEHSSPFTWLTQSQLNLNLFKDSEISTKKSRGSLESQEPVVPTKKPPSVYSFVDPPNIVLGGSTTKLVSNTELKFPPKSSNTEDNSEGLIHRLKNKTAVLKIQSLKSAVGRSGIKKVNNTQENESLVMASNKCTVVPSLKLLKPVGVKSAISKPKNPPPPPPPVKSPLTEIPHHEFETKALLSTTSTKDGVSPMNINKMLLEKEKHFEDFDPSTSGSVLKTGFDFLDNW